MIKKIIFMLACTTFYMSIQGMLMVPEIKKTIENLEQSDAILVDAQNFVDVANDNLDDVQVFVKRLIAQQKKMIARTDIAIAVTIVALFVLCATIIERVHWEKSKAEKELEEEVLPLAPSKAIEPKNP